MTMAVVALSAVAFLFVLGLAWVLARPADRRLTVGLVLGGLLASVLKIWLFQQAPQWRDINPDSLTYELNARAFAMHWRGQTVDAYDYNLRGLRVQYEAGVHGRDWAPDDRLSYAQVYGANDWLYPAYVGFWYWAAEASQRWVIYSNALWASFLPAAAFGIAIGLGACRKVALAAAGLAMLDPSAGVNASWLLKDTLSAFLAMGALWSLLAFLRRKRTGLLVVFVVLAVLLGGVRQVAFLAMLLAGGVAAVLLYWRERLCAPATMVLLAASGAWLGFGLLQAAPRVVDTVPLVIATAPVKTVDEGLAVLRASRGSPQADDAVLRWKQSLRDGPLLAILKSVAHTLFAPYPWVAIHPGLTWRSSNELYYPGMLLWMACLPGILIQGLRGLNERETGFITVVIFLAAVLAAYTVYQGEWSTRQRVFALPAFFALAAMGWERIVSWRQRKRLSGQTVVTDGKT